MPFKGLYALWLKLENLVELLGYCVQVNLCVVAYDFATMGLLCDILHSKKIDTSSSECVVQFDLSQSHLLKP